MVNVTAAAAALFLCFEMTALPPTRLQVDLVFGGQPISQALEASAMEEVTGIWSAYGVDVRRQEASDDGRAGAVRLDVTLADPSDASIAAGALGSIKFFDDVPGSEIVMYPATIAALVQSASLQGRNFSDWPFALRDRILGRAFGRALAHEIGHFLLRTTHHSAAGLMQWRHVTPLLVAPERQRFSLSREDAARFTSGLVTASPDRPERARP